MAIPSSLRTHASFPEREAGDPSMPAFRACRGGVATPCVGPDVRPSALAYRTRAGRGRTVRPRRGATRADFVSPHRLVWRDAHEIHAGLRRETPGGRGRIGRA